ncbi:MAG: phosphoribosylglycinamide formyltransferase [Bacteroidota bacterium]
MNVKRIAIFASGSGTNAENIISYFTDNKTIKVDSLWSNKPNAFALKRAEKMGVDTFVFTHKELNETGEVAKKLKERKIDLIVLAGFLWLIPLELINNFSIINIHPALLPKYGGKGMYGMKVHQSVVENCETESGITIHLVNPVYDDGEILFQAKCPVKPRDTPEEVARKVHELEYKHYPKVIEKLLLNESRKQKQHK